MRYYLNIGTNLGDRMANLRRAIAALIAVGRLRRVSAVMESAPWGFASQNAFLNVGVAIDIAEQPLDVLDRLHDIEHRLGSASHRDAAGHYVDRLVDIDIMAIARRDGSQWQPITIDHPRLQVPHPHLHDRPFFLQPYHQLKK